MKRPLVSVSLLSVLACSTLDPGSGDLGGSGGASTDAASTGGAAAGGTDGAGHSGGAPGAGGTPDGSGSQTGGVGVGGAFGVGGGSEGTGGAGNGGAGTGGALSSGGASAAGGSGGSVSGLSWPIDWPVDCVPESTCYDIGYPDTDIDGVAFDCGPPGYEGHQGTDIPITWEQMDAGVAVRAAADGTVFFASDGKFDRCPDDAQPDCQNPPDYVAGSMEGTTVCTELGPYCHPPGGSCFWCFAGGNVVVLLHEGVEGVFATRYDHLKNGSVLVTEGDTVLRGEQIAEVGSAGNSTGPHLHFEVWADGYYDLADPWMGACGPNTTKSLWVTDPPWEE